jgi:hypothetical protein
MKTFIILILSCASIYGADTSIQVFTTTKTNLSGSIFKRDVFMRDGQTNLVGDTIIRDGKLEMPLYKFYHGGVLVGEYITMPDSSVFITEAGSPYSVIGKYWPSKGVSQAFICTKDRVVLDYFTATNGVFHPADSAAVRGANKMTTEMSKLIQE